MTVYLDVLLIFNLYVNYIVLRLTARMTHSRLPFGRALGAAALGSLSTLMIFLPALPLPLNLLCKLLIAVLLCAAAFGWRDPVRLCWNSLCLFGTSFLLAGILLALALLCNVRVLHANSCWYLDVSLLHLVVFTIAAYLLLSAVQYLRDRYHAADGGYRVFIRYRSGTAALEGLADTGNSLVDYLTGCPVIICDKRLLGTLLPDTPALPKGCRLLPCTTIAGTGMLAVFRPDEVLIESGETGARRQVDALIGVSAQETGRAIFHPKLLRF